MLSLIAAAGRGTRLGAAAKGKPKCLFPVRGAPILAHLLDIFIESDVRKALCVLLDETQLRQVKDELGDQIAAGLLVPVLQHSGAGNAYAVKTCIPQLDSSPCFYCDADILFHPSLPPVLVARLNEKRELDAILVFAMNGSIAPTHKSAAAFQDALFATAAKLDVRISMFHLMGLYLLQRSVVSMVAKHLPEKSLDEISMSSVLQGNSQELKWEPAWYTGPWWHLAYPEDIAALDKKVDALELPRLK